MQAGIRLKEVLIDLEFHMRDSGLWQEERPSDWAFSSELPFFHDRMSFPEWLQFVFIPNLLALAEGQSTWPENCAVAPMADYYFDTQNVSAAQLIKELEKIDQLVSAHAHGAELLLPGQAK